jgi:ubiquinone/menaquinone biosynthesis C-methylase UbiE
MQRVLEPELMDDAAQALAYARADFAEPNGRFVEEFDRRFPGFGAGRIADLGCGPGDIVIRLARRYPRAGLVGVDGADAMLAHARAALAADPALRARVSFELGLLPAAPRGAAVFDAIVSNSLLHHLPDPDVLWTTVRRIGRPGAAVMVMDLARPASREHAAGIVAQYAADEPEVLREDFYNSLLAAFEPAEVEAQLARAGLAGFTVGMVSDRHWLASGRLA